MAVAAYATPATSGLLVDRNRIPEGAVLNRKLGAPHFARPKCRNTTALGSSKLATVAERGCAFTVANQRNALNTFETIALAADAGFCLMARSSSPIMRYSPSNVLSVTYCSMLAASPLMRPNLTACPAN